MIPRLIKHKSRTTRANDVEHKYCWRGTYHQR